MWRQIQKDPEQYGEIVPVQRVTSLIDGSAYFKAFMEFAQRAERRIFIMGWDFDTRLILKQDGGNGQPLTLGGFIESLLLKKPQLEVRVLCWDFAAVYLFERQLFPALQFSAAVRSRIAIKYDGQHVAGASQHQKVVLIDNGTIFMGGVDFGIGRHDSPEHKPEDPLRNSGFRKSYMPVHDVQLVMSGYEIGRWFEHLAVARWDLATGERLQPLQEHHPIPWPDYLPVELQQTETLVSLTRPSFAGLRGSYQIQNVLCDAIAQTQRFLYIENQFFTSTAIFGALQQLLATKPEAHLLMVLPSRYHTRAEAYVIGYQQRRLMQKLQTQGGADRVFPTGPVIYRPKYCPIAIHSKILIVDDEILSIGSANFNNRSMGLDFEVNVSFFAEQGPGVREFIQKLRNALLAEHMDLGPDVDINALCLEPKRFKALLEEPTSQRGLRYLSLKTERWQRFSGFLMHVIDARKPLPPALFIQKLFRYYASPLFLKPLSSILLFYFAVGALVGLYLIEPLVPLPFAQDMILSILAMVALPFTLNFGFMLAAQPDVVAWVRFFIAAGISLAAGQALGLLASRVGLKDWYRKHYYSLFSQQGFSEQSLLSITFLRLLPLVPFSLFNFFAAVFGVKLWRSWASALLSTLPAMLGMFIVTGLIAAIPTENDTIRQVAEIILLLIATLLSAVLLIRLLRHRKLHKNSILLRPRSQKFFPLIKKGK